jgi:hypothetical protein
MMLTLLAISCLTLALGADPQPPAPSLNTGELAERATHALQGACPWASLPPDGISTVPDGLSIRVAFDNGSMRGLWTPEVSVAYLFDGAVAPVARALLEPADGAPSAPAPTLHFVIRPLPHDWIDGLNRQAVTWELTVTPDAWREYRAGTTGKAAMLTSLQVTVDGAPLPFNPTVAADVE